MGRPVQPTGALLACLQVPTSTTFPTRLRHPQGQELGAEELGLSQAPSKPHAEV